MEPKLIPATISKVMTMADHSVRVFLDTQEIDAETRAYIFGLHEKLGYFVFAEQPMKQLDMANAPEIVLEEGEKSPSGRMRPSPAR